VINQDLPALAVAAQQNKLEPEQDEVPDENITDSESRVQDSLEGRS
jgi:hypothetical protein